MSVPEFNLSISIFAESIPEGLKLASLAITSALMLSHSVRRNIKRLLINLNAGQKLLVIEVQPEKLRYYAPDIGTSLGVLKRALKDGYFHGVKVYTESISGKVETHTDIVINGKLDYNTIEYLITTCCKGLCSIKIIPKNDNTIMVLDRGRMLVWWILGPLLQLIEDSCVADKHASHRHTYES